MAQKKVSDYLVLKEMSPGRHGHALVGVRKVAVKKELTELLPRIDHGIELAREAQRLDFAWETTQSTSDRARGDALEIKRKIVRQLTSIYSIVDGRTEGDEGDEISVMARELIAAVFARGVQAIANNPFEVFNGSLRTIIEDHFEEAEAKHVEALGIEREVSRLKRLAEQFRLELEADSRSTLEFDDVEIARDAAHEATSRVIVGVLDRFGGEDEGSARTREELLAPIDIQQERVAEARARHDTPTDVDVDTGEELDRPLAPSPAPNTDVNTDVNTDPTAI